MGARNLKKGDILFREGDASDAMFVIKSGRIAITKAKGSGEIVLAELGPGDMLGEMAFFDNKPRSAGARATVDTVVIELPFKGLHAQFKTFPEWLKAIVKTVNSHLRSANQRIKNLERSSEEESAAFPEHMITRLIAILTFVAHRYGETEADGVVVPSGSLRRFTIQVFQQPTNKMQTLMDILMSLGHMKVEDLGEGRQKITIYHLDLLFGFVEYYNEYLFTEESKRVTVLEKELKPMRTLLFYGRKETPDAEGNVKVNLTSIQASAFRDAGDPFNVDDVNSLSEKGITGDKVSLEGGIGLTFNMKSLETLYPYWEIIYALKKVAAR